MTQKKQAHKGTATKPYGAVNKAAVKKQTTRPVKAAAKPPVKTAKKSKVASKPPAKAVKPARKPAKKPAKVVKPVKSVKTPARTAKQVVKMAAKRAVKPAVKPAAKPGKKQAVKGTKVPARVPVAPAKPAKPAKPVKPARVRMMAKLQKMSPEVRNAIVRQPKGELGAEIEAFCPRCKAETTHVVASLMGEKIRRIKCRSCSSEHNYHRSLLLRQRLARSEEVPVARARRREEASSLSAARMFDEQMIGRNPTQAKVYLIKEKYYVEDLLTHSLFGIGLVMKIKEDEKIEVLFRSGAKVLAHNRFIPAPKKK